MKMSDRFGGNYLKTETLTPAGVNKTIAAVVDEEVGKEMKPVIYFDDQTALPLNKTNAMEIVEMYGNDSDDWIGKVVRVYKDKVMFEGKMTPCTRVGQPIGSGSGSGSGSGKAK